MKLGIVGSGMIVKDFLKMFNELKGIELLGISARNEENLKNLCVQYPIERYYLSYEEMLENKDIDTIYVAVPNDLHFIMSKKALLAGKNVICEKPFTTNLKEALELKEIAKKEDLFLLEAIPNRFFPNTYLLKEKVKELGNIRVINFNFSQYSSRYDRFKKGDIAPAFDPNHSGGSLMDLGVYNINLIMELFGKPENVDYYPNIERGIDTSGVLMMDYGYMKAVCVAAKDCQAPLSSTIQGDEGYIVMRSPSSQITEFQMAFNKQEEERQEFDQENEALNHMQMVVGKISAVMNPLTFVIINGAIIALFWIGGVRVDCGAITQGQVVALINYMSQILVELVKLANLIINVNKSVACGNRIWNIFEIEQGLSTQETKDAPDETGEYEVSFDHVDLTYPESMEPSLTDINLHVKKGETVGIIGGTGSGKSSLVHLIPRFYDITGGSLKVKGKPVTQYDINTLRSLVAVVQQKSVLFKGTIRSNLLWGKEDATEEELWEALRIAQAEEVVRGKDGQLDELVEQDGRNFSGGQKQRLSIARALVRKPEILIMDDSSSALDYATDARLRQAISQMASEVTVFIVSQRAASVRGADQILVLDDGKVVGAGKHEQLLQSCEIYREIYESQYGKEKVK